MSPENLKALLDALTAVPLDPEALKAAVIAAIASVSPNASADSPGADALVSTDTTPPDPSAPGADPKKPPPGTPSSLTKSLGLKSDDELSVLFKTMQETIAALSADRDASDLDERRGLIAELVQLGFETPATAWLGKAEDRKPVERLATESLASMKTRLVVLRAARPKGYEAPKTPAAGEVVALSKTDAAAAKKLGMSPEEFTTAKKNAVRRA